MIHKILIANRGEIACRIIRTAKINGIKTLAVYSTADAQSQHTLMADEAIFIGNSPPSESYLNSQLILQIAQENNVDAIHPGYGFLSENADFAKKCELANIHFIGPSSDAIAAMGSKSAAKAIMKQAGVPIVPGYHGEDQTDERLIEESKKIGYPQLIKAAFGGGGKGMRVVQNSSELQAAITSARREALSSFGDDKLLIERYLTKPRHIEVQVFADNHGNYVYLADRDCSVQRRHQKVIEEAPAPNLPESLRKKMGLAAIKAAKAINYVGAGTVEFLFDPYAQDEQNFFFMEMNTRLQVEHPVTELITGQDLVYWQLLVAANEPLPLKQNDIHISGHAIEARIYAEDPANDFLPASGKITYLKQPEANQHIRIDTGIIQGDCVTSYYDPMIAKLIIWDNTRQAAILRMKQALQEYKIVGVKHNIPFLRQVFSHQTFTETEVSTDFIENNLTDLISFPKEASEKFLVIAALYQLLKTEQQQKLTSNPWQSFSGFRLNATPNFNINLIDNEQNEHRLVCSRKDDIYIFQQGDKHQKISGALVNGQLAYCLNGHRQQIHVIDDNDGFILSLPEQDIRFKVNTHLSQATSNTETSPLTAPMNGKIVTHLVACGESVKQAQGLLIIEAMKMEYTITAPSAGVVQEFYFKPGELVADGSLLVDFTTDS